MGRDDLRELLTKVIPMRYTSVYQVSINDHPIRRSETRRHLWWQWRDKILGERIQILAYQTY